MSLPRWTAACVASPGNRVAMTEESPGSTGQGGRQMRPSPVTRG